MSAAGSLPSRAHSALLLFLNLDSHRFSHSPKKGFSRLTIGVLLVRVGHESAVVPVVGNAVVVIVMVTGVSLAIFVMVGLVGIGHIGTVVQVVLVAVLIDILVVVASVSNAV